MDAADLTLVDGSVEGSWIEPGLGGEFGAVTLQVPPIFEAHARVFHPAEDREGKPARWSEVAKACGTAPHKEMQWHAIVGQPTYVMGGESDWPGSEPSLGDMDIPTLDALCRVLAAHSADPSLCFFGLCTIQSWEDEFTREELRTHPLLELPKGRDHIVLSGPLAAVDQIHEDWSRPGPGRATFTVVGTASASEVPSDDEADASSKVRCAPNLIWAADRSWLVVSEVDFDSTLVGGDRDLVDAIVASPDLEAWEVDPDTSLAEGADKINAPTGGGSE